MAVIEEWQTSETGPKPELWIGVTLGMAQLGRRMREVEKQMRRFAVYRRYFAGPPPLCVNGHEYHRRQRRRVKRNR